MNKVKLACDLQSLSRNVIMLVLFTAAVIVFIVPFLVPVQWFLARKSYISLEGEGKLALFRTEDNVLLCPSFLLLLLLLLIFLWMDEPTIKEFF